MFFISTFLAQLVYTLGGLGFHSANGSMMIEVVPFFHILATSIASEIGEDDSLAIIATTLAAYAFSSTLTAFFILGALKLGIIVGFFHVIFSTSQKIQLCQFFTTIGCVVDRSVQKFDFLPARILN
ncbi:hypothetical protein BYT27DRAFT_6538077 [Phlegmacium glaucopus]|nr:hypothetical protein BYT27DRAFT_6538077 [Phlegmacium glaucopus]